MHVATVDAMMTEDAEVISIYYGADASEEKAEELASTLEEKYPDCEVEAQQRWSANLLLHYFCRVGQ